MSSIPVSPPIESPCLRICEYDKDSRQCSGCKRTLDEIANWSRMTAEGRRAIMEDLKQR